MPYPTIIHDKKSLIKVVQIKFCCISLSPNLAKLLKPMLHLVFTMQKGTHRGECSYFFEQALRQGSRPCIGFTFWEDIHKILHAHHKLT